MQPLRQAIPSLRSKFSSLKGWSVPILMYHNICDDPEPGVSPYYQTNTSPAVFRQHMQFLADHGYKTLSLTDLVADLHSCPNRDGFNPQRHVAITFDDAFRSVYTEAFPVLQHLGFTASVFLPTAFIGDIRRQFCPSSTILHAPSSSLDCMTWSEVAEAHRHGIEFGSHTVNHPELVKLDWRSIELEVANSKTEIEDRLGKRITAFCYPFAFPQANRSFTQALRGLLLKTGYTCCLTTQVGRVDRSDDPFCIKRLPVNSLDDVQLFASKLAGAYDWIALPQQTVKWCKAMLKSGSQHGRPAEGPAGR